MSKVSVNREVTISLEKEEMEILEKAHKIVKDLRHDLFMADDESDEYFNADNAEMALKDILEKAGRHVK